MGRAIAVGLVNQGYRANQIEIVEPDDQRRSQLSAEHGFKCLADSQALAADSAVVILAVKPQVMHSVLAELGPVLSPLQNTALIVSIAAGITTTQINQWLSGDFRIVRVMPNTPAMIGLGASASFANDRASSADKTLADAILSAVGINVWVEIESDIDAVTALSGSGPAYFFLVFEALEAAAVKLGLSAPTARRLAQQTALGAASLALQSGDDPANLRRQVTSPGGTTERALEVLRSGGLEKIINDALVAAQQRAQELARESEKIK